MRKVSRALQLTGQYALIGILSGLMIAMPLGLTGCTSSQVQDSLNVAAQVATSAASIIAPVSPEYGALVGSVGALLKDVSALYAAYQSAAAADKPGIAGKINALLGTISANLQTILADAHVKAPALVQIIGVAVAVINTAVTLVIAHLPKAAQPAASVHAAVASMPVLAKAKSASDLASAWNNAVGQGYPQAVVQAPNHGKKLGIF